MDLNDFVYPSLHAMAKVEDSGLNARSYGTWGSVTKKILILKRVDKE